MDRLPDKLPFSKRRLRPRIIISYVLDYVIIIACAAGFYILDSVEPFHQHFSLRDISIQYPYAEHERIPIGLAICISCLAPLVIIAVYTLFIDGLFSHHKPVNSVTGKRKFNGPYRWKDRLWEFNCGLLGLLLAQGTAFVITQILKTACGKPRPDLIDRCKPRPGSHDLIPGLSNYTICQGDPVILKDGFRSWPSASFAGLFYLTLWLSGKLHLMDNRGEVWKTAIIVTPCIAATLIAVSRIMDARAPPVRRHHWLASRRCRKEPRVSDPDLGHGPDRPRPTRSLLGTRMTAPPLSVIRREERLDAPPLPQTNVPPTQHRLSRGPTYTSATGNPYATDVYDHRMRHDDGNWSSSSEDVADGYEMQQGYAHTHNPALGGSLPRYEDTAYHSKTQPTMPGDSSLRQPLAAHPDRGRELTEMPPREP
ncbi:conserved hypothetical protein [Aspergillus terreus NIH2624]|uniref:Phosphatidic acid phosphatase type 2/haloperoxidase domain-containing protein n=1 Tax=Aspergillus terreus (strain NIH 2624 / FGSC A1156) TaxID=341663 RepID=Q0CLW6_ASPTN|nr:uncharacterized protein ATEG_05318 [Aspergillus terreus NIH2624]EAU34387.1 conserved hypothetical protein [Aspergillus terreus NIH2624]